MARFDIAIREVLRREGGYVDHPKDPGGATKFGISLRFLRRLGVDEGDLDRDGDVDKDDIRVMTLHQAREIFESRFWYPIYTGIHSQDIATKILDIAVLHGHRRAHCMVQRACRATGRRLKADGLFGPKTLAAVNATRSEELIVALRCEQACYMRGLEGLRDFPGWLPRAYDEV